jgi:hypothetical protein
MPDGSMLTAFGTGELCDDKCTRRDAAVIRWRLDDKPVGKDSKVRDAAFESDARNVFDPAPRKNIEKAGN